MGVGVSVSWPLYAREGDHLPVGGAWVGPRTGLDTTENLAPTGPRTLNRPARSESLCRLSNRGRIVVDNNVNIIRHGPGAACRCVCATSRYLRATITCLKL
jgi:hypothetical protein